MSPRLVLQCKHCEHRPDPDSVLEAQLLHFQVEHDTDKVEFDLIAVCDCGARMTPERTAAVGGRGGRVVDYFRCPADNRLGQIWRKS